MTDAIFNKAIDLIKKTKGYDPSQNISDYWFNNTDELSKILDERWFVYSQDFGLLIRWHSEMGCECQKQIRNFVQEPQKNAILEFNTRINNTQDLFEQINETIIDFNTFTFNYKGQHHSLIDFVRSFGSKTSQIYGQHDLRGIDLSNMSIHKCTILNCVFAIANFSNSSIFQTTFNNCSFGKVNFDNAWLGAIVYDSNTGFGNISIKNTRLDGIDLRGFTTPRNIKIIGYWQLIIGFFMGLFFPTVTNSCLDREKNHTVFLGLNTKNNTEKENIEFISYVDWFQYVTNKIENIRDENIVNKIQFFLALATTKYWSSYVVLGFFSIMINFVYAFIYYALRNSFLNIKDFGDCLYFSIVTFTTLGFGDITPVKHIAQFVVISEVIIGYMVLGVFVFLLSKKVNKLF